MWKSKKYVSSFYEQEKGDAELIEKFAKRDLRVTREHNEECKRLLRLMGTHFCLFAESCSKRVAPGPAYP